MDNNNDDKTALYRVVIMDNKKEEFVNNSRNKMRIYVKEYDEAEIDNLPKEQKEKEEIKGIIDSKRQHLILNCQSGYSEVYHALLHLKVNFTFKFSY